jgi:hypothetical protein
MKISNSPYSYNNRVAFGHNKGVLQAIDKLKKDVTPEYIDELQGQLQDVKFTNDFVKSIQDLSEHWKKVIIKYAPDELQDEFRKILGVK